MRNCPTCGARYEAPAQYCQRDGAALRVEQEARDPYLGTKILGQFRLERVAGSGGMGMVYGGWDEGLGRRIAVKILHRDLVTNRDVVARFHREAQIAHQLDHPNIVRVILFGQLQDGNLYLVLEYLEGPTLMAALEQGPMHPVRAVKILSAIADAMGYAHRRDIVHRDLKPENVILVNREGDPDHPKVLDFGIAKMLMGADTVVTQAGLIFGTARYISPEGAQGDPVDKRSDVYSLGVIAYQMLTGHTPFEAAEPVQLLLKQIHEQPPRMSVHTAGQHIPPALEAVVMRALAKTPAARYGDGASFGRALREALTESDPNSAIKSMTATVNMPMWVTPSSPGLSEPGDRLTPAYGTPDAPQHDSDSGVRANPAVDPFGPQVTMLAGSLSLAPQGAGQVSSPAPAPANARGSLGPLLATMPALGAPPAEHAVQAPRAAAVNGAAYAPAAVGRAAPAVAAHGAVAVAARMEMPVALPAALAAVPAYAAAGYAPIPSPSVSQATAPATNAFAAPNTPAFDRTGPAGSRDAGASTGSYAPPDRTSGGTLITPADGDEDFAVAGLPRRGTRVAASAGMRTARTVILSCALTVLAGAGAAWALGLYPSQRHEAQMRSLLHRAEDALNARRFTHGEHGDNVEDVTDAILAISPGQARARQMRLVAAQSLRNRAVELRNDGHVQDAVPLLYGALRLSDNPEYRELLTTFQRERREVQQPSAPPVAPPVTPPARPVTRTPTTTPRSRGPEVVPPTTNTPPPDTTPAHTTPTFTPGRQPTGQNHPTNTPTHAHTPVVAPPPTPVITQPDPRPPEEPPTPVITQPTVPPEVGF